MIYSPIIVEYQMDGTVPRSRYMALENVGQLIDDQPISVAAVALIVPVSPEARRNAVNTTTSRAATAKRKSLDSEKWTKPNN